MRQHIGAIVMLGLMAAVAAVVGWQVMVRTAGKGGPPGSEKVAAVAVEVGPVTSGEIRDVRVLSGTLEASTQFVVAPKVGGLLKAVLVDLGDRIERDQIVARIDDAEFVQQVEQAQAELAVRKAGREQAASALELARREHERALELKQNAMASEAELDVKAAAFESAQAALALADAQVKQAEAALALARISLGHTEVRADWTGGPDLATVGERLSDAGNTVQSGSPILSIVSLDPLTAVVFVTERDYVSLSIGQRATLHIDALPDRTFDAEVSRIAPVFRETSRQARVELRVHNSDELLKPGMFARVTLVLRVEQAETIVPLAALARRDNGQVVFALTADRHHVRKVPVRVGITENQRVQVTPKAANDDAQSAARELAGHEVVTLGQQLLEDGAPVLVSEVASQPAAGATASAPARPGSGS